MGISLQQGPIGPSRTREGGRGKKKQVTRPSTNDTVQRRTRPSGSKLTTRVGTSEGGSKLTMIPQHQNNTTQIQKPQLNIPPQVERVHQEFLRVGWGVTRKKYTHTVTNTDTGTKLRPPHTSIYMYIYSYTLKYIDTMPCTCTISHS